MDRQRYGRGPNARRSKRHYVLKQRTMRSVITRELTLREHLCWQTGDIPLYTILKHAVVKFGMRPNLYLAKGGRSLTRKWLVEDFEHFISKVDCADEYLRWLLEMGDFHLKMVGRERRFPKGKAIDETAPHTADVSMKAEAPQPGHAPVTLCEKVLMRGWIKRFSLRAFAKRLLGHKRA